MWPFKKRNTTPPPSIEELGHLLHGELQLELDDFFRSYSSDRKAFMLKFQEEVEGMGKELSPLELLYTFGLSTGTLILIDWRGEENEEEIEAFIESRLGYELLWENTATLRGKDLKGSQRDGEFIKRLLQSIDLDLRSIGKRLLFFDLPWDAYVFMPVESRVYDVLVSTAPVYFKTTPP